MHKPQTRRQLRSHKKRKTQRPKGMNFMSKKFWNTMYELPVTKAPDPTGGFFS